MHSVSGSGVAWIVLAASLGLGACAAEASEAAPDAGPGTDTTQDGGAEYERSAHDESDTGAFVIVEARCDLGDKLLESRCSEGAKHWHDAIPTIEAGPGYRCGDYGAATATVRCAGVTPGAGQ